jgi:DNA transformation protein
MHELEKMPNIGKKLAKNFYEAGIRTPEQLKNMGPKDAFLKLREIDPDSCLLSCYAITGAIEDVRWHDLPKEKKDEMKKFFMAL